MTSRLIAIGDIHGCANALDVLLSMILPQAGDRIVTLGDYVDRGPDSKGVIDRLIALRETCEVIAIQGNHEEMMLEVLRGDTPHDSWVQFGGVATLDSYGFIGSLDILPPEHVEFFDSMVDHYESDEHFFVHANYDSARSLEDQEIYQLRWQKLTEVVPPPHPNGKKAVVGHTHDPEFEIFDVGHLICLDTYCYGGGWLSALEVNSGRIWQADMEGEQRILEAASPQ